LKVCGARRGLLTGRRDEILILLSCARRGGRCVRLLRNRSRERISSSNQLFQARTRLARTPGGRVGRLPAGVTIAEKSTRYDTWHSAPNHMEPPSAAPRPGLRDAATHVCECVSAEERMDCIPDIGHPWSHLIPNTSTRGPASLVRFCGSGRPPQTWGSQEDVLSDGTREEEQSRVASAVADVSARDASASPPGLVAFSPNGDVRVNTVAGNNSEAMSLLEAPPMREAPIVGRAHAIVAHCYADRDTIVSSCPVCRPPRSQCKVCSRRCLLYMYLLSR
jgi:hypothetical protein